MKHLLLSLAAVALLVGPAARLFAKDEADAGNKTVAVVTIASYDRLMSDVAFIGKLAGNPDLDKNIDGAIQLFTQGQGLNGLDKKRPLAITLTTDGQQFQPMLVVPVTDLKQLLESLAGLIGEASDAENGAFELNVFGQQVFVKESGGWAFVAQSTEAFANLPADPLKTLGGLDKSYDLAARIYVQNVPDLYRSLFIDNLRKGVEGAMSRKEDESDEDYAARKKIVEAQTDLLTKIINEVEQLTVGVAIDAKAKSAHLDLSVVGVPGSDSAKTLSRLKNNASDFAGFLVDDAAASLNITLKTSPETGGQIAAGLQTFLAQALQHIDTQSSLNDDSKKLAKEMVKELFDAVQSTLESGRIDAGATLNLSDKAMTLVAGAYVAEPKNVEAALKKFAKLMANEPNFPGIKFDAAEYQGIRFHTTSVPVPDSEDISKVLGGKLDVAVGIGAKSVYLALGTDSMTLCKSLIDKSKGQASKQLVPVQLHISLAPIFQFAAAMHDEPQVKALAEELAQAKGSDRVHITLAPDGNATRLRIEAEEGVLQLIGSAFRQAGGLPGLTQ